MRVIVTGSRDWPRQSAVEKALEYCLEVAQGRGEELELVHGACPSGADAIAHAWALAHGGVAVHEFRADWSGQGRAAGPMRNQRMVDAGADEVWAFIKNGSRGATDCADRAERAGIPVTRILM